MSTPHKRASDRGKSWERQVAKDHNTTRVLRRGTKVPDVVWNGYQIDCKNRQNLNVWLEYWTCVNKYGHRTLLPWKKPGSKRAVMVMDYQIWLEIKDVLSKNSQGDEQNEQVGYSGEKANGT